LLVGVNNTFANGTNMRERDFTPTKTGGVSGGAPAFLRFFKEELMPHIMQKYHAKPTGHTLYGGSLGGLFAMYALFHEPSLFTSYIAIDPSLWWDDYYLNKQAAALLPGLKFHNTLWIVGRTGSAYHHMGTSGMDTVLQRASPAGLQWQVSIYDNDTHYSSNFKGFYDGLKFSYGGFYASMGGYLFSQRILLKPTRAQVLKNKPFTVYCFNLAADKYVHYTTGGATPVASSPLLAGEETGITVQHTGKIRLKALCMREEYNREDSIVVTVGDAPRAVKLPANTHAGGLQVTPSGTMVTEEGFIAIPADNYYVFCKDSDNDSSSVWLAGTQIFGDYPFDKGGSYVIWLNKGYYPIKLLYTAALGRQPLFLQPKGSDQFIIPPAMLYSSGK
jgi:hypothetical protein